MNMSGRNFTNGYSLLCCKAKGRLAVKGKKLNLRPCTNFHNKTLPRYGQMDTALKMLPSSDCKLSRFEYLMGIDWLSLFLILMNRLNVK